ncbi:MAG TPA: hypothetical protein PKG90_00705 [Chitinophagaceae bacterium]|nr:hypothetical protein [Chitinophagaceae bacterium]HNU12982.1 hypothetical protein [Chitinophagaceae bacterium]
MKKNYLFIIAISFFLLSCGSDKKQKLDGAALSDEVCNCKMKTKGMKYDDPERVRMWKECLDLQGENYKKVSVDKTELEIYTKNNSECMKKYTLGN